MRVTRIDYLMAAKTLEDSLQRITGEAAFDAWLDEIPADVEPKPYATALNWMLSNLRQYRKPSEAQIRNVFNIARINLTFNPAFGGTDTGGYFS